MMFAIILLLQTMPVPAVPPPPAQVVADCAHPTYASDMMVCGDERLLALDRQLGTLLAAPMTRPEPVIEEQGDWFRRSRMCAARSDQFDCLRAAYRERIAVVGAASAAGDAAKPSAAAQCDGKTARLTEMARGMLAIALDGRTFLASTATELAAWTPFAYARRKAGSWQIRWLDGRKLRCTVTSISN